MENPPVLAMPQAEQSEGAKADPSSKPKNTNASAPAGTSVEPEVIAVHLLLRRTLSALFTAAAA